MVTLFNWRAHVPPSRHNHVTVVARSLWYKSEDFHRSGHSLFNSFSVAINPKMTGRGKGGKARQKTKTRSSRAGPRRGAEPIALWHHDCTRRRSPQHPDSASAQEVARKFTQPEVQLRFRHKKNHGSFQSHQSASKTRIQFNAY